MTPVLQTRFGTEGNCWAACLATIFDLPLSETESCACNYPDWREQTEKLLSGMGLFSIEIQPQKIDGKIKYPFVAPPHGALCILAGISTGGLAHVVVAKVVLRKSFFLNEDQRILEFELVHDPLGIRTSCSVLDSITDVIFFAKLFK